MICLKERFVTYFSIYLIYSIEKRTFASDNKTIKSRKLEKLFQMKIDYKLILQIHVEDPYKNLIH